MIKNKKLKTFVNLAAGILAIALFIALFIVSCFTKINFSFLVFALFLGSYMMFPPSRSTLEIFSKKQDFAEVCEVVINEKTPLYRIMRKAEQRRYSRFTVTDKNGGKLGTIEEGDLSLLALKYPADTAAAELLKQRQDNS